ncbi:hypothetical protein BGZ61DRAFT_558819, partial [Ilyonectria robusta]|uniref:uncharacterized protein n=1 Tax=Ilyonectria robusta TaxID=1079257 RepID=UPI001E8EE64B
CIRVRYPGPFSPLTACATGLLTGYCVCWPGLLVAFASALALLLQSFPPAAFPLRGCSSPPLTPPSTPPSDFSSSPASSPPTSASLLLAPSFQFFSKLPSLLLWSEFALSPPLTSTHDEQTRPKSSSGEDWERQLFWLPSRGSTAQLRLRRVPN